MRQEYQNVLHQRSFCSKSTDCCMIQLTNSRVLNEPMAFILPKPSTVKSFRKIRLVVSLGPLARIKFSIKYYVIVCQH